MCEQCCTVARRLQECSGCRHGWFCSTECQRKAWPRHRVFCKLLRAHNQRVAERHGSNVTLKGNGVISHMSQVLQVRPCAGDVWYKPNCVLGRIIVLDGVSLCFPAIRQQLGCTVASKCCN